MSNRERTTPAALERKAIRREPLQQARDQAQAAVDRYEASGTTGREYDIAKYRLEAAKLDFESYDFERDATGAWKGESLGVDIRGVYDRIQTEDGGVDTEKAGRFHLIQINMGELDRVNKLYGHKKGDEALGATARLIYSRLESIISALVKDKVDEQGKPLDPEQHYDVYRTAGNDFSVLLRDVDAETATRIRQALAGELEVPDIPQGEGPPLLATHVPFSDAASYFNDNREAVAGGNPGRAFVDVAKEQSQMLNDMEKNNSRVDRILTLDRQDPEAGKKMYDNYLKQSVGRIFSSEPLSYEAFKAAVGETGDVGMGKAIKRALEDFRIRQRESHHLKSTLTKFVLEKKGRELAETKGIAIDQETILAEETAKTGDGKSQLAEVKDYDAFLKQSEPTAGEMDVADLKSTSIRLSKLVESCRQQGNDPDCPVYEAKAKMINARLHAEEVRRNPATGLYERGMFFQDMKKSLDKGEHITVMSIDMAFLKYFDKEGGLKTGNAAIKLAARILDQIVGQYQFPCEAYRMGGDEFSLMLGTEDPKIILEIQNKIREMARQNPMPALDESRTVQYREEAIQFNFGVHTAHDMASLRQELKSHDIPLKANEDDKQAILEESAEYLFMVADRQLEIEKTIQRLMFLVRRYATDNPESEAYAGNYRSLEDYSDKAIGGQEGRDKVREWVKSYAVRRPDGTVVLDVAALQREVMSHVMRKAEKSVSQDEQEGAMADRLIESMAHVRFLSQRAENLQSQIDTLTKQLRAANQNGEDTHRQIEGLKAEIVQIKDLRGKIEAAA